MRSQPPFILGDFLDQSWRTVTAFPREAWISVLDHPLPIACLVLALILGLYLYLTWPTEDDARERQAWERARMDAIVRLADYRARPETDQQITEAMRRGRGKDVA